MSYSGYETDEYEYYNYGTQKDGSFVVGGGGLGNGNAYATIEYKNNKYYYCEYGNNPKRNYVGNFIEWGDDNEFNIK
jgi:hypothetical protein